MNLFKKLFKRNNDTNKRPGPDIDELLKSTDINGSIIELDNYIAGVASYGDTVEELTPPQRNFFFNQNFEREVNNGGFNQYFINSGGGFAHETITSLQSIGANKTAAILQHAIDQFPGSKVPKDRDERHETVRQIEDEADKVWGDLDQKFFKYEDNLNALNIAYVKANRNSF
jgi:hypothetical protein